MASNLVIVAIPGEDDRVWKVSSEKVPHLTILHLGDLAQIANLESIVQFVEHAANTSLERFYLPVDRRGELGADQADVLFFKKGRYDFKAIRDFRSLLLKDSNIKTAYDSSTQFETPEEVGEPGQPWIPHLTLGYPASPAKPMADEYSTIYDVCFNKIAVWTGDYEGPEFLLKNYWDEIETLDDGVMDVPLSVAYSDLEHHGVKGMRWGVRKSPNTPASIDIGNKVTFGPGVAALRIKSGFKRVGATLKKWNAILADSSWEHSVYSDAGHEEVHNHVAESIDHHVDKLARSPKYREKNLRTDRDLQRTYYQDVARVTDVAYRKAVKDVYGENYTGTKTARYIQDPRGPRIEIRDKKTGDLHDSTPLSSMRDIKKRRDEAKNEAFVQQTLGERAIHAATSVEAPDISIDLKLNDLGQISGVTFVELSEDTLNEPMAQTMELGEAFLIHYGVKGMRWGQRKEEFVTRSHQRRRTAEAATREKRPARDVEAFPTIGTSKRAKAKINTTGGHDHPPTEDAIQVAVARRKLEKSGVAALSNHELQVMERRLNLESNVQRLAGGNRTAGQKFVDGLLGRSDKKDKSVEVSVGKTVRDLAEPAIQKEVGKQVGKHGAKVGAQVTKHVLKRFTMA
jgi:2'-5' RNA ligase